MSEKIARANLPGVFFPKEHPNAENKQKRKQLEKRMELEVLLGQLDYLEKHKAIDSGIYNSFMISEISPRKSRFWNMPFGDFNKIFDYLHNPQFAYGLTKPLSFAQKFKYFINETDLGTKYRLILLEGLNKFVKIEISRLTHKEKGSNSTQQFSKDNQILTQASIEERIESDSPRPKPYQEDLSKYLTKVPQEPKNKILYGQENLFDPQLNEFYRVNDDLIYELGKWLEWRSLEPSQYPDPETRVLPTLEHFYNFVVKKNSEVFNSQTTNELMRLMKYHIKSIDHHNFIGSLRLLLGKLPNNQLRTQVIRELDSYVTYMSPQRTKFTRGEIKEYPWVHQNDSKKPVNNNIVGDEKDTIIGGFDDFENVDGQWSDGSELDSSTNNSVVEITAGEKYLQDFRKNLKPNGTLIPVFDESLDEDIENLDEWDDNSSKANSIETSSIK